MGQVYVAGPLTRLAIVFVMEVVARAHRTSADDRGPTVPPGRALVARYDAATTYGISLE